MTARRMERQRIRESMPLGAEPMTRVQAAQKATEKATEWRLRARTRRTKPETAIRLSTHSHYAAASGNGQSNANANDSYADDYQSSPYADDPYGDGGGGGAASLMDMLAAIMAALRAKPAIIPPRNPYCKRKCAAIDRTLTPDPKPDTSG